MLWSDYDSVKRQLTRLVALTVVLCLCVSAQPEKPIFSANDEVDENDLKCAVCLAVVDIVDKHMMKKSFDGIESRLYEVMENVCEQKNFKSYDFIPPKMMEGCKKFVDSTDDEKLLDTFGNYYRKVTHKNRNDLERSVCLAMAGDCVGSKRMVEKKEKKTEKTTNEEDKAFDDNVAQIMRDHGHKIKKPKPVQQRKDEL